MSLTERCRTLLRNSIPAKAIRTANIIKHDPEKMAHILFDCDAWYDIYDTEDLPPGFMETEEYQGDDALGEIEFNVWCTIFGAINAPDCVSRLNEIRESGV